MLIGDAAVDVAESRNLSLYSFNSPYLIRISIHKITYFHCFTTVNSTHCKDEDEVMF